MKKIIFILFLPCLVKAQVYIAGQTLPAYVDIIPDTVIDYVGSNGVYENYYFDVNGDSQNDFQIQAYGGGGLGGGSYYIKLIANNSNSFSRFGRYDSLYHPWLNIWIVTAVAKPLSAGDTVNFPNAIWDNSDMFITDKSGGAGTYKNVTDWVSISDKYIGIKFQSPTDTFYGWIRVNVPFENKCNVKDYSVGLNCSVYLLSTVSSSSVICVPNSATLSVIGASTCTWSTGSNNPSIVVSPTVTTSYTVNGTTSTGCSLSSAITQSVNACIGIKEYELTALKISPNPVQNNIYIGDQAEFQNSMIEITSTLGQSVIKQAYSAQVDVSSLENGCYFIKIRSGDKMYYSKFVKE